MYPRESVPAAYGLAAAGQLSIGAVTFQVPGGVKVASIQWDPNGGFGANPPATWLAGR